MFTFRHQIIRFSVLEIVTTFYERCVGPSATLNKWYIPFDAYNSVVDTDIYIYDYRSLTGEWTEMMKWTWACRSIKVPPLRSVHLFFSSSATMRCVCTKQKKRKKSQPCGYVRCVPGNNHSLKTIKLQYIMLYWEMMMLRFVHNTTQHIGMGRNEANAMNHATSSIRNG